MKTITLTIFLSILSIASFKAILKPNDSTTSTKVKFEFAILPVILYNSLDIGFSIHHNRLIESKLNFGANIYWAEYSNGKGLKLTYNLNFHIKNTPLYIPIWLRTKNDWGRGYEEQYMPNVLRHSIGTGIGKIFDLENNRLVRTEFGIGYSQQKTNRGNLFHYSSYQFDTTYPNQFPKYVPAFRLKINLIF